MPEISDAANLELSRRHGIPVVSASYRLAPEDPFPAGVDDGVAVARWLLDNGGKAAAEGGFGSRRIIVGGESAGGYLAAAVLLRIRDELGAIDRVAGANLVYGIYDWGRSPRHLGLRLTDGPDLLSPDDFTFFTDRAGPRPAATWISSSPLTFPTGSTPCSLRTHLPLGAAQRRMVRPRARPGSPRLIWNSSCFAARLEPADLMPRVGGPCLVVGAAVVGVDGVHDAPADLAQLPGLGLGQRVED
jgi:acetyl esterase/lipase